MIWWRWIIFVALTIFSAILYRWGGSGYYDTKARDIGCMLCNMLSLWLVGISGTWWQWLIASGLTFASYTTYHKWLNPLFGRDKENVHWYGWFMHGLAIGCALLLFYQSWKMVLIRAFGLGFMTMAWSEAIDNAVWEERGRGFLSNITLLWFLIC